MNKKFLQYVQSLPPKYAELLSMEPVTVPTLPLQMPRKGAYLFSEDDIHLYVGRTNHLRSRLQTHYEFMNSGDTILNSSAGRAMT